MIRFREEKPEDAAGVRRVLEAAFGGKGEADLVDRLCADGDIVLSLVAEDLKDGILACLHFPRLALRVDGAEIPVCGLAPLAVLPRRQREGSGSHLVEMGLSELRHRGEKLVFVLGDQAFYRRFGFDIVAAAGYASPYAGPHFQVLRMDGRAPSSGTIRYPRAFDGLD
ncbi:MAG: GNAT family N-acetyltransferase [Pseudorhodoplanes sp.]